VNDDWASRAEFFRHSGGCEDEAIAKYATLRKLVLGPEQLWLVVVRDLNCSLVRAVAPAKVACAAESDRKSAIFAVEFASTRPASRQSITVKQFIFVDDRVQLSVECAISFTT